MLELKTLIDLFLDCYTTFNENEECYFQSIFVSGTQSQKIMYLE